MIKELTKPKQNTKSYYKPNIPDIKLNELDSDQYRSTTADQTRPTIVERTSTIPESLTKEEIQKQETKEDSIYYERQATVEKQQFNVNSIETKPMKFDYRANLTEVAPNARPIPISKEPSRIRPLSKPRPFKPPVKITHTNSITSGTPHRAKPSADRNSMSNSKFHREKSTQKSSKATYKSHSVQKSNSFFTDQSVYTRVDISQAAKDSDLNLKNLESIIGDIKQKGFYKLQMEITQKNEEREKLKASIDRLQREIQAMKSSDLKYELKNSSIEQSMLQAFIIQEVKDLI